MSTLLERTLDLARRADSDTANRACEAVGVSRRWFNRLRAGDFQDPGVNKIEQLHKFLKRRVNNGSSSG